MADFDAYLIVDWSASSSPKKGEDSIWYSLLTRRGGIQKLENPSTRLEAYKKIRQVLGSNLKMGLRTLVGFDFPYGYPDCFAEHAGLSPGPPWRALWEHLHTEVDDKADNRNNRGQVASRLNCKISADSFPFWGNGLKAEIPNLCRTKPQCPSGMCWKDKRIVEERCRAQSAFKLAGAGSVGGQALLGIPYLKKLRDCPELSSVSRVWPFETGLSDPACWARDNSIIVHAEIYPSFERIALQPGEIKDCAQVKFLAEYFAERDQTGALRQLFAGPSNLTGGERKASENNEGWILGVL